MQRSLVELMKMPRDPLRLRGGGESYGYDGYGNPTHFIYSADPKLFAYHVAQTNCALSDERSEKPETVQQHDSE